MFYAVDDKGKIISHGAQDEAGAMRDALINVSGVAREAVENMREEQIIGMFRGLSAKGHRVKWSDNPQSKGTKFSDRKASAW